MSSQPNTERADGPAINRPQSMGKSAEAKVRRLLESQGRTVTHKKRAPYDLLVDGSIRVEVKCASPQWFRGFPSWCFNIHRHGVLKEGQVDVYVLRLEGVPYFKNAIHLLFLAPISKPTLEVSLRSLLTRYATNAVAFQAFAKGQK